MATIYIPNDYPDIGTALMAASSGDTLVFTVSAAYATHDLTSALDSITVQASAGIVPVLDHTYATTHGLEVTGDTWTFEGVTFRSSVPGDGGSALVLDGTTGHEFTACIFEGSPTALAGDFTGTVSRCQFRHITTAVTTSTNALAIAACEFLRCGGDCVNANASTVTNCTFIACDVDNIVCVGDVIKNCTAQGSVSADVSGHVFDGNTSVTYCNAYESDVGGSVFNAPSTSNNTTVDPLHVNLYTDLRLLPASTLIRAGTATGAPASDYNDAAYQAPPTVGAHESIAIASATPSSAYTLAVVLTGTYIEADVEDRNNWTVTPSADNGALVTPASVSWNNGTSTATLTLWPAMSPGVAYTVTADFGGYGYDTAAFTPSSAYDTDAVGPYRYVAAIMNALGRQFFDLAGTPQTNTAEDIAVGAETVLVNSTLYFPDAGAFWAEGIPFTYTSKTDGAFHGVETSTQRIASIPSGALVVSDERAHIPDP